LSQPPSLPAFSCELASGSGHADGCVHPLDGDGGLGVIEAVTDEQEYNAGRYKPDEVIPSVGGERQDGEACDFQNSRGTHYQNVISTVAPVVDVVMTMFAGAAFTPPVASHVAT